MKNTQAVYGEEFSRKILEGVEIVEKLVTATMGSHGKYVIIEDENGMIRPTSDGVSVAHSIVPEDSIVAMGSKMIIDGSVATVNIVGDGTTTTVLLSARLYKRLLEIQSKGVDSRTIMNTLEEERKKLLAEIDKLKKTEFTKDTLKKIALVSSHHDDEIATIVSNVWDEVGVEGIVDVTNSDTGSTNYEVKSGYRINNGYVWDKFATRGLSAEYDKCIVFSTDHPIDGLMPISGLIERARNEKLPIVIFAPEFSNAAIESMIKNHKSGMQLFLPIEWPQFGDKDSVGEELAAISGGQFISRSEYSDLKKVDWSLVGVVDKVAANGVSTVINFDETNEVYKKYLEKVVEQKSQFRTARVASKLDARIARLKGKTATIRIYAATNAEYQFKYDVYDDCVKAVKNAMLTGYVAGGGSTYRYLSKFVKGGILEPVLLSPMEKLLFNFGFSEELIKRDIDSCLDEGYGIGFDLNSYDQGKINLEEKGIIEPAGLVHACIDNACSVASLLFNTEAGVAVIKSLLL